MALTDIEAIRLKTSDRAKLRRNVWEADGEASDIKLEFDPDLSTMRVWKNGGLLTVTTDYVVDTDNGVVHINALPAIGDDFTVEYTSVVFTDEELQFFLDEAAGNTTLASAFVLFAWASNAAKNAKKESAAGGGGFGSVTLDLAVRARELREAAKGFLDQYQTFEGKGAAVELITQVGWTDATRDRQILRQLLGLNNP